MARTEAFDVAVVGGGSGGTAAAVAAARRGARTVLIERYGFLGGAATNAQVQTFCGYFYRRENAELAVGGIALDVLAGLERLGASVPPRRSRSGNWIIPLSAEALKACLDELVTSAGLAVRAHAFASKVEREGDRIVAVEVVDHLGTLAIEAQVFVDASGEADLASLAAVDMLEPQRDADVGYAASLCARIGGIPKELVIDRDALRQLCDHEDYRTGNAHLRRNGGVIMPIFDNGDLWWMGVDTLTDGLSSESLTKAEMEGRRRMWQFMGLFRQLPGCADAMLVSSGPQVGIREGRHPVARTTLTGEALLAGARSETGIARAAWPMEGHDVPGVPSMVPIGGDGFADIPLGCLRAEGVENLWLAGRTIGTDRLAYGSTRVMGTAFATGQAAGTGAALQVVGRDDHPAIAAALVEDGCLI